MSDKPVLFHNFPFRSCRCAWWISELELDDQFEIERISLHGNSNMDEYANVHPYRTIPALKLPSGEVILESAAICLYISEVFSDRVAEKSFKPATNEIATFYNVNSYLLLVFLIFSFF